MTSTLILISVLLLVTSQFICKTSGNVTTSNVQCRAGHSCGKHAYSYFWCYTDNKNNWDYCCGSECKYDDQDALRCKSGSYDLFCGNPGTLTARGNACRSSHPCGHHSYEYYWCYTDDNNNWAYCCHPGATCSAREGYGYKVCNAGLYREKGGYWTLCYALE